ncbi:MAG: restriction endonuclease subunit S [Candidatus Marinarcus sp.]|uniref:restriction endonuclease subunit S n=1 Tax=Candidatus Marinarcus sp. TaxID=3100987 RepID=UPI003B0079FA
MKNKSLTCNVPELRFSEFKDEPEWKEKPLGKCLLKHPDYGVNAAAVPFSENLPTYLRITDISVDGYYLSNEKVSVDIDATSDNYLEDGDIVLARTGASVGKSYKYRKEDGALVFAGFLIRVKPDKKKLNSDLLFHFLSTDKYWSWVNITSARSGQPGINGNEYASLLVPIPATLEEQQKIADCLSSIDNLITAQSKKVEALKEHKKGLTQQLFPTDGEKVPKRRFPEFLNDGEWEEKPLSKVGEIITGSTPATANLENYGGSKLFVSPADISDTRYITTTKTTLSEQGFMQTRHIKANSILFVCIGSTIGKVAQNKFDCATNQQINSIVPFDEYSNDFIYSALENSSSRIASLAGNHAVPIINKTFFSSVLISCPLLPEQQKIADFLSSIDNLITAQSKKIETLKEHKKGLMQQLFPSNNIKG